VSGTQVIKFASRSVGLVLVGLALFFIGKTVVQYWDTVRAGPQDLNVRYLLAAALLFLFYSLYQTGLWRWILSGFGARLDYLTASHLFFTNNLLAYIPGKVANVTGMATLAKRKRISPTHVVTTVVLFQLYSLISGTGLIAILSVLLPTELGAVMPVGWLWMIGIASLVGLLLISPHCLRWTFALLRRLSGRNIADVELPFRTTLAHLVAYGIGWLLTGAAMWCLFMGFGPKGQVLSFPAVVVVFLGSYLVGLLAIAIPAGIGISEAGMVYGLGALIGPEQALFGAASFRLVMLAISLISWLVVTWMQRTIRVLEIGPEQRRSRKNT
jgi:uncharacterized membrane protein YbhN (UPF0104 family)